MISQKRGKPSVNAILATIIILPLAACYGEKAVFVTNTSFGVDLDPATATTSIGVGRQEIFVGPRFDDGDAPSVVGNLESSGTVLARKIRQFYATGAAANTATNGGEPMLEIVCADCPTTAQTTSEPRTIYFGTNTNIGLQLGFANSAPSFNLGYKRQEASVIPILASETDASRIPSLLASINNDTNATSSFGQKKAVDGAGIAAPAPTTDVDLDHVQFFATGQAAENLAQNPDVLGNLAKGDVAGLLEFDAALVTQRKVLGGIRTCVFAQDENGIIAALENAHSLGILKPFSSGNTLHEIVQQRLQEENGDPLNFFNILREYNRDLVPDGSSDRYTSALIQHQNFVCSIDN